MNSPFRRTFHGEFHGRASMMLRIERPHLRLNNTWDITPWAFGLAVTAIGSGGTPECPRDLAGRFLAQEKIRRPALPLFRTGYWRATAQAAEGEGLRGGIPPGPPFQRAPRGRLAEETDLRGFHGGMGIGSIGARDLGIA
jgi:hypothetical protein